MFGFFSEIKSATQKTPETKTYFQLVRSNKKQKTVKQNIVYWPLAGASELCSQKMKRKERFLVFLCSIEWAISHQNQLSSSRDPGGTDEPTSSAEIPDMEYGLGMFRISASAKNRCGCQGCDIRIPTFLDADVVRISCIGKMKIMEIFSMKF